MYLACNTRVSPAVVREYGATAVRTFMRGFESFLNSVVFVGLCLLMT